MQPVARRRTFDLLIGVSAIGWATLAIGEAGPVAEAWPIPLLPAGLNLVAGVLFLRRSDLRHTGNRVAMARCLPALALGAPIAHAAATGSWGPGTTLAFMAGCGLSLAAFVALGRSFAVLPALRRIKTHGPYAAIRHPAYAGELVMLGACAAALGGALWYLLLPVVVAAVIVRIRAEESLLIEDPAWAAYAQRVPWRLAPGVW